LARWRRARRIAAGTPAGTSIEARGTYRFGGRRGRSSGDDGAHRIRRSPGAVLPSSL
jgi:hypothetical protein